MRVIIEFYTEALKAPRLDFQRRDAASGSRILLFNHFAFGLLELGFSVEAWAFRPTNTAPSSSGFSRGLGTPKTHAL
jgi:hypothetical protein